MPFTIECVRSRLNEHLMKQPLEPWFEARASKGFEPFYSSIDIRDAGFKIAPVDANLYPAGFNNICPVDMRHGKEVVAQILTKHLGFIPKKMAILPEFHTRNAFYADNLLALKNLFASLNIQTEIGWMSDLAGTTVSSLKTATNHDLAVHELKRQGAKLVFDEFEPDFILLNNDFSSGFPAVLQGIAQPIEPSIQLGWHSRKKSDFFEHYNRLVTELANAVNLDPWQLQVITKKITDVDFDTKNGLDRVAQAVDEVLAEIKVQYAAHDVDQKPFVFVKNNSGTYGMGIMRVESGLEILTMNRKERNKMDVGKNNLKVSEVLVQEGIPTRYQPGGITSEPVIYLLGNRLLGGFLRQNPSRDQTDNLNSKGMVFKKLCLSDLKNEADRDLELELVYGTIAQLSCAAISLETEMAEKKSKQNRQKVREHAQINPSPNP